MLRVLCYVFVYKFLFNAHFDLEPDYITRKPIQHRIQRCNLRREILSTFHIRVDHRSVCHFPIEKNRAKMSKNARNHARNSNYFTFNEQIHNYNTRTHTHTTVLLLVWNMSGSTRVSRYQKGKTKKVKTNQYLLEQERVSGSSICWVICKSAPHADNHANIPPLSFFTGRMPFLTPNQQRQSTEGTDWRNY